VSEFVDRVREMMEKVEHLKEAILIYTDAVDAAVTQLRKNLEQEPKGSPEMPDMSKLQWRDVPALGNPKGPWQKCIETAKQEFQAMQKILEGKSPLWSGGFIYWLDQNKTYIGRRAGKKR